MRMLVVEDEIKVANFIKRGLERDGYEVHTARDGEEGLKRSLEQSFDLIVLDWMLPKKDGLSMLKDLRREGKKTPVLMLSAKNSIEDIMAALDSGSDGYLTKPFAFAELTARVRALVRRSEMERGAQIHFADLRLDPVSHKLWRNDKEIGLTAREYSLLEYFMRNPNQVVNRTMIAEHWDYTLDTFTNIVDVYINYLRKKISQKGGKNLIHTVRGVGYVLKEEE